MCTSLDGDGEAILRAISILRFLAQLMGIDILARVVVNMLTRSQSPRKSSFGEPIV